jgi:hypothetical protein
MSSNYYSFWLALLHQHNCLFIHNVAVSHCFIRQRVRTPTKKRAEKTMEVMAESTRQAGKAAAMSKKQNSSPLLIIMMMMQRRRQRRRPQREPKPVS